MGRHSRLAARRDQLLLATAFEGSPVAILKCEFLRYRRERSRGFGELGLEALHQVRAVTLTDYPLVAASVGLDPAAMLTRAGLSEGMIANSEARLPAIAVAGLLEDSAEVSGCEGFGILMAGRRTFQSLGGIALVLERLETLREVIGATQKMKRRLNDVFELTIAEDGSGPSLIALRVLPQFAGRQAVNLVAAMTHLLFKGASRGSWRPVAVHFPHPQPADPAPFENFFGGPVHFESARCGFECEREALDRPFGEDPLVGAAELASILQGEVGRFSGAAPEIVNEMEQVLADIQVRLKRIISSVDGDDHQNGNGNGNGHA